jgi:hypothetical protein
MEIKKTNCPNYSIQENGLIGSSILGEGRMIPALVLNCENDSTLSDLIDVHLNTDSGDVIVQWGSPLNFFVRNKIWTLNVKFSKPMEFEFNIDFDLEKHYSIIDAIFQSRGLYIGYGFVGDKVSKVTDKLILIEVADTKIDKKWNDKLFDVLKKRFRKNGANKKELNREVNAHLKKMREILTTRVK